MCLLKRLLIPATTVPVNPGDGTPSFVLDLAERLAAHFDVIVLAPRVPGTKNVDEIGGVTVRRFAYFPRRWEKLAADAIMPRLRSEPWRIVEAAAMVCAMMWHTVRYSRRSRCDVINAHWIIPGGMAAWLANKVNRVPFVLTAHGADVYTLNGRLMRLVKAAVLRNADAVLPVSSDILEHLMVIARGEVRIHPPVPMGVASQHDFGIPRSDAMLVVGRLADKKGVDVAIRSVAASNVSLRIVGEGPERRHLETLVESLGVADRVVLLGSMPRERVLDEMRTCLCLLIPSRIGTGGDQEGTPVVLAEAMSLGTPVIASRIAGLGDYIEDGVTGWLVPPDDVGALTSAIKRIVENPGDAAQVGARALRRFSGSALDVESTVAAYAAVISEVEQ
jgi:colanic acid/amylovoran biosynthesis glycosyltransferase